MSLTYQQRTMAPRFTSAQVFKFSIPTHSTNVLPKQPLKHRKGVGGGGKKKKKKTLPLYKEASYKFSSTAI